jgi:hypothetical protein
MNRSARSLALIARDSFLNPRSSTRVHQHAGQNTLKEDHLMFRIRVCSIGQPVPILLEVEEDGSIRMASVADLPIHMCIGHGLDLFVHVLKLRF